VQTDTGPPHIGCGDGPTTVGHAPRNELGSSCQVPRRGRRRQPLGADMWHRTGLSPTGLTNVGHGLMS
jgi:hypothetical protein